MLMVIRFSTLLRSCFLLAISVIVADVYFLLLRESLSYSEGATSTTKNSLHHYGVDHVVEQALHDSQHVGNHADQQKKQKQQQQNSLGEDTTAKSSSSSITTTGKDRVLHILARAGYSNLDKDTIAKLPTWQQVVELLGSDGPVLYNTASCSAFQQQVPAVQRMLGAAGMFSTGTNLVTALLKANCQIPERVKLYGPNATKEQYGIRWQVPWGKHTPAHYRNLHATQKAKEIAKTDILPIVMIRNPWHWMQSMCKNPYTARWSHHRICPNLIEQDPFQDEMGNNDYNDSSLFEWNQVEVTYGAGTENYKSLVHLWSDWYAEYMHPNRRRHNNNNDDKNDIDNQNKDNEDVDNYPYLVVRMEDVIFHTEATIKAICTCAGGVVKEPFHYEQQSAKRDSPGHDTSTGYLQAWIRYSQSLQAQAGFTSADYHAAMQVLEQEDTFKIFRYKHPSSA